MSAFKLSKDQIKRRDEIMDDLQEKSEALESAVEKYNEALDEIRGDVEVALEAYNESLADAQEFVEEIASDANQAIEEKSERWQEGERGQEALSFKEAWEQISVEGASIDFPDPIEFDGVDYAEEIGNAPDELGSY